MAFQDDKANVTPIGAKSRVTDPGLRTGFKDHSTTTLGKGLIEENLTVVPQHEPIVTRRELWSYYLYYNGDNGVGPLGFSMTLFQSLANASGYDPVKGAGSSCNGDSASGQCVVPWGKGTKAVSSVVLIANGVSFAIMTFLFTTIGSAADYGTFGRWLLFIVTCICWASQYAEMSLTAPRWHLAMGLYIVGFVSYGATLVFYAALFPRLARNTLHSRTLKQRYENGEIGRDEYDLEESLEKNRISNISTAHSNIGYIVTLCLNLSILLPLASNPKANNYTLVLYVSAAQAGTFSAKRRLLPYDWMETGELQAMDTASIVIWLFVDVERGRKDAVKWADEMKERAGKVE